MSPCPRLRARACYDCLGCVDIEGGDENLARLIQKLRTCAQKTAERVFVDARNRIDNMGGFKEFINSQNQRKHSWDESPSEDQQQQHSQETYEREQYELDEREVEAQRTEEEEFTMEIMLRMAGVEEGLIGWDRELTNFRKE